MEIIDFIDSLDLKEFDYFYHETDCDNSKDIMEEGLLVKGTNILGTRNVLFTTALPLTKDLVSDEKTFRKFLESEKSSSSFRNVSEMVILGAPKEYDGNLVKSYESYKDGELYEGIVEPNMIVGYIDLDDFKFHPNINYDYGDVFDDDYHI